MANPIPPLAHAPMAHPLAQRMDLPPQPAAQRATGDRAEISSGAVRLAEAALRGEAPPAKPGAIDIVGKAIAELNKAAQAKVAARREPPPTLPSPS